MSSTVEGAAKLFTPGGAGIIGDVRFSQKVSGNEVTITGELSNLPPLNTLRLSVFTWGDLSDWSESLGQAYQPRGQTSEAMDFTTSAAGAATLNITTKEIALIGQFSVFGRSLAIVDSQNGKVASTVIGIADPARPRKVATQQATNGPVEVQPAAPVPAPVEQAAPQPAEVPVPTEAPVEEAAEPAAVPVPEAEAAAPAPVENAAEPDAEMADAPPAQG